jgi:ATP-dependent Clp protease ATP-binding subunit ClpB
MMNKFDHIVLGALDLAQTEALKLKALELHPLHLLWGLISHPQSVAKKAFKEQLKEVTGLLKKLPQSTQKVSLEQIKMHPQLQEWLTLASSTSIQKGHGEIQEEDLLKHLPHVFPDLKLPFEKLSDLSEEAEVPSFLTNLNELAQQGKLDPVIGRTKEIRAVMEILGRRGKNNPVLVGPAGVGKTAIVEGLAEKIVKNQVPDVLQGKTVYALDLGALMAGTKYRGEFEERLQQLLKFVKGQAGEAILFIDEIHQLVGAGKTDGAMDAANLLKPALARGELHCIGATTNDEYQKYILGDSALDRRFREVPVLEPSKEDAIEIMMGVREKLEIHHGIKISDAAIYQSVLLSDQYITNKYLPDKAIDLVDEASSALKLSAEAMPADLALMEAEIRTKSVAYEVDKSNDTLKKDIENLSKEFQERKIQWEKEVYAIKKVSDVKNQLERARFELENAQLKQDYETAGKLKYSLIPELEQTLNAATHDWVLKPVHIAEIIARQTGIPIEKILKSEQEHILQLEAQLKSRVFGQDQATKEVAATLKASFAGLTAENRPLGSFLLVGPSGVGKTETAKAVADFLFNSEKNMIRLDMSEYSEKHAVAKLIGAPPGYIGHDQGGVLTEAIRRRPYSVILFDEIEKAHPDFADILLQILDDGRLTDSKGRTIDFKNTVIFLTTNSRDLKADFKPELLGRLDATLTYLPLGKEVMEELIKKQLMLLNARLKAKKITLSLSDEVMSYLCEHGHDDTYGARPLNALFQRVVIRPLSVRLLEGNLSEGPLTAQWSPLAKEAFFS